MSATSKLWIKLAAAVVCAISILALIKAFSNNASNEGQGENSAAESNFKKGELVKSFPKDKVPIVPGEVITSSETNLSKIGETNNHNRNWQVTINFTDDNPNESIKKLFRDKKFTQLSDFTKTNKKYYSALFSNYAYTVAVTLLPTPDTGRTLVYYNVSQIGR